MTSAELKEEIRAITDLNQRLSERIETLTRRLTRHLNNMEPQHWPPRGRDDEDEGSD
jgi:hypothetical protein